MSGFAGLLFWLFFMPDFFAVMSQNAQMPAAVLAVMKVIVTAFLVVLYILLPLIFVLIAATIVVWYIVTGLYRLGAEAWWVAVGFTLVTGASGVLTFAQVSLLDYYATLGLPEAQMAIMRRHFRPKCQCAASGEPGE